MLLVTSAVEMTNNRREGGRRHLKGGINNSWREGWD
jgi:hypothetical protein